MWHFQRVTTKYLTLFSKFLLLHHFIFRVVTKSYFCKHFFQRLCPTEPVQQYQHSQRVTTKLYYTHFLRFHINEYRKFESYYQTILTFFRVPIKRSEYFGKSNQQIKHTFLELISSNANTFRELMPQNTTEHDFVKSLYLETLIFSESYYHTDVFVRNHPTQYYFYFQIWDYSKSLLIRIIVQNAFLQVFSTFFNLKS